MPVNEEPGSRLLGLHLLAESHEPWLLGKKLSQHISVSKLLLPVSCLSCVLSCEA